MDKVYIVTYDAAKRSITAVLDAQTIIEEKKKEESKPKYITEEDYKELKKAMDKALKEQDAAEEKEWGSWEERMGKEEKDECKKV